MNPFPHPWHQAFKRTGAIHVDLRLSYAAAFTRPAWTRAATLIELLDQSETIEQ
jgi:hypothetical protein